jgi:hypothetical protein
MVEYDISCPFERHGLCGLNDSTGRVMEDEEIERLQISCFPTDKEKFECVRMRRFVPVLSMQEGKLVFSKPGGCIADISDTSLKIKARTQRIDHLELEKITIQDKIDIMKHEIEELNAMLDKPRK